MTERETSRKKGQMEKNGKMKNDRPFLRLHHGGCIDRFSLFGDANWKLLYSLVKAADLLPSAVFEKVFPALSILGAHQISLSPFPLESIVLLCNLLCCSRQGNSLSRLVRCLLLHSVK